MNQSVDRTFVFGIITRSTGYGCLWKCYKFG